MATTQKKPSKMRRKEKRRILKHLEETIGRKKVYTVEELRQVQCEPSPFRDLFPCYDASSIPLYRSDHELFPLTKEEESNMFPVVFTDGDYDEEGWTDLVSFDRKGRPTQPQNTAH
eukprot:TRINITY_DN23822_c0_g1_i1.p1 TRINITY_DN23822_c0_g1~~TRINITY_DN23822_c0_g1_i1.p1  ORF type:complete len:116 (-),score=27.29 TRINITY_DN23822_c0_g1_i1:43-390(-)